MAEELHLASARGKFPAGQNKGKREQAHGTNLLDDFAEALIEVRSRDAYFPLIASLRPPTAF